MVKSQNQGIGDGTMNIDEDFENDLATKRKLY